LFASHTTACLSNGADSYSSDTAKAVYHFLMWCSSQCEMLYTVCSSSRMCSHRTFSHTHCIYWI